MPELTHAIVIMATFHALSGFILGLGITTEIDLPGGTRDEDESTTATGGHTPAPRLESNESTKVGYAKIMIFKKVIFKIFTFYSSSGYVVGDE